MHFREAKLPIHVQVEQVTGEGAPELPSATELRDRTMALIEIQEDYCAKATQNRKNSMTESTTPTQHSMLQTKS